MDALHDISVQMNTVVSSGRGSVRQTAEMGLAVSSANADCLLTTSMNIEILFKNIEVLFQCVKGHAADDLELIPMIPFNENLLIDPQRYYGCLPDQFSGMVFPLTSVEQFQQLHNILGSEEAAGKMAVYLGRKQGEKGMDLDVFTKAVMDYLFDHSLNSKISWEGTKECFSKKWTQEEKEEKFRSSFQELDVGKRIRGLIYNGGRIGCVGGRWRHDSDTKQIDMAISAWLKRRERQKLATDVRNDRYRRHPETIGNKKKKLTGDANTASNVSSVNQRKKNDSSASTSSASQHTSSPVSGESSVPNDSNHGGPGSVGSVSEQGAPSRDSSVGGDSDILAQSILQSISPADPQAVQSHSQTYPASAPEYGAGASAFSSQGMRPHPAHIAHAAQEHGAGASAFRVQGMPPQPVHNPPAAQGYGAGSIPFSRMPVRPTHIIHSPSPRFHYQLTYPNAPHDQHSTPLETPQSAASAAHIHQYSENSLSLTNNSQTYRQLSPQSSTAIETADNHHESHDQ